jgi:hypothetical protein
VYFGQDLLLGIVPTVAEEVEVVAAGVVLEQPEFTPGEEFADALDLHAIGT